MSVIVRTAAVLKKNYSLIYSTYLTFGSKYSKLWPFSNACSPRSLTRAIRDYLRDDVAEILINKLITKLITLLKQSCLVKIKNLYFKWAIVCSFWYWIQTAYEREVKLPSGGSIVRLKL